MFVMELYVRGDGGGVLIWADGVFDGGDPFVRLGWCNGGRSRRNYGFATKTVNKIRRWERFPSECRRRLFRVVGIQVEVVGRGGGGSVGCAMRDG